MARDPSLDITFDCLAWDSRLGRDAVPRISITASGYTISNDYTLPDYLKVSVNVSGAPLSGFDPSVVRATISVKVTGDALVDHIGTTPAGSSGAGQAWIAWSKVGDVRFVVDKVSDAGYMPMLWSGPVYQIRKLGNTAIVYGYSGISRIFPVSQPMVTYGLSEVLPMGLKWKGAVCGNEYVHFFISSEGDLWSMTAEGPRRIGYREYLSPLTNPVILYDSIREEVFVGDASTGYTFYANALGGGYGNLSGIVYKEHNRLAVSPGSIVYPAAHIVTDTVDFARPGLKSIEWLQFGVDTAASLYAAVDYKYNNGTTFATSPWVLLNTEAAAYMRVSGKEFRIRLKNLSAAALTLSYINVGIQFTDSRYVRGVVGGG